MAEYQGVKYSQGPNIYGDLQNYRFALGGTETKFTAPPRVDAGPMHQSAPSGPGAPMGGYKQPGTPAARPFTPQSSGLGAPNYRQVIQERNQQASGLGRTGGGAGDARGGRGGGAGVSLNVGDVNIGGQFAKNVQGSTLSFGDNAPTFTTNANMGSRNVMRVGTDRAPAAPKGGSGGADQGASPSGFPTSNPSAPMGGGGGGGQNRAPFPTQAPIKFGRTGRPNAMIPNALGSVDTPTRMGPKQGELGYSGSSPVPMLSGGVQPMQVGAGQQSPMLPPASSRRRQAAYGQYMGGMAGRTQSEQDTIGQMAGMYGPWQSETGSAQPSGPLAISGPQPPAGEIGPAQTTQRTTAKKTGGKTTAKKTSSQAGGGKTTNRRPVARSGGAPQGNQNWGYNPGWEAVRAKQLPPMGG